MSTNKYTEINVRARYADLLQVSRWLDGQTQTTSLSPRIVSKIQLVVEELFTNSVDHGYRLECDLPIRVSCLWEEPVFTIFYADQAPGFNPCEDSDNPAQFEDSLGGNGLQLIRKLPNSIEYRHEDSWNHITVSFAAPNNA